MAKGSKSARGMTRRLALGAGLGGSLAACATGEAASPAYAGVVRFDHGVASGDPLADRVVIWTRVTPETAGDVPVQWVVARDEALRDVVKRGAFVTGPGRDYTVKVDVVGLPSGAKLFYGFAVGETSSPVGRTCTAPTGSVERLKVAVASCSNHPFGYFNAYAEMAKIENLDLVLHLGDYIYEYGLDGYGGQVGVRIGRPPEPPVEIVTLSDYRLRHAQYKADKDLQAAHAAAPWLVVWDDHETTNDSWMGGAQNHQPETEGDWETRKAAALQAYFEWMPIRDMVPGRAREQIYRSTVWGDLVAIAMLETRLTGRTAQLDYADDLAIVQTPDGPRPDMAGFAAKLADPSRSLLGQGQEAWLAETFEKTRSARWRLIGNQVLMVRMAAPDLSNLPEPVVANLEKQFPPLRRFLPLTALGVPLNLDAWDGYPVQRERVYSMLKAAGPTVVVTGDTHAAWANQLHDAGGSRVAVEFGTTSITSPSLGDLFAPFDIGPLLAQRNEEILWTDQFARGFLLVTFDRETVLAEFFKVSTILDKTYTLEREAAFTAKHEGAAVGALTKVQA